MARKKRTYGYKKKSDELLRLAKSASLEADYFFVTTFDRYETLLQILDALQDVIDEAVKDGETLIAKEYVKGRPNMTINPAIAEYNKTVTSANQTAAALLNIIKTLSEHTISDLTNKEEDEQII